MFDNALESPTNPSKADRLVLRTSYSKESSKEHKKIPHKGPKPQPQTQKAHQQLPSSASPRDKADLFKFLVSGTELQLGFVGY